MNDLCAAFWRYHHANPHVYTAFRRFASAMKRAGRKQYSARTIVERIRWDMDLVTSSEDGFKIANAHSPYYARLLEHHNPEFVGFFRHQADVTLEWPEPQMSLFDMAV